MNRNKPPMVVLVSALFVVLAGCMPGAQLPITGGTAPPEASAIVPSVAVQAAQQWLAQELNVTVPEVEIVRVEQTEWPDSCLGVVQAGENCLQVITPGWRAVFMVNGQQYEVHTDETGSTVRLVTPSGS